MGKISEIGVIFVTFCNNMFFLLKIFIKNAVNSD
jgi:hypothetical protein